MNSVAITGNTYPVKDAIKALGGRWDAAAKAWLVPTDKAAAARNLVAGLAKPVGFRPVSKKSYSQRTGCSCGSVEGSPRSTDCRSCKMDY